MTMMIKGLEVNKSLTDLDVSGNNVTAATVVNLIKVLSNSRITYLGLKGLRLSSMVVGKIEELARDKPDIKIIA
jgi:Ran GTPase-activating protein (RanGAP) involved in mRNA processing and transport